MEAANTARCSYVHHNGIARVWAVIAQSVVDGPWYDWTGGARARSSRCNRHGMPSDEAKRPGRFGVCRPTP